MPAFFRVKLKFGNFMGKGGSIEHLHLAGMRFKAQGLKNSNSNSKSGSRFRVPGSRIKTFST
jgi:hypothetical protein